MFCRFCGTQLPDTAAFCAKCGNKVNAPAVPVSTPVSNVTQADAPAASTGNPGAPAGYTATPTGYPGAPSGSTGYPYGGGAYRAPGTAPTIVVGGRTVRITLASIAPAIMILILIIGMVGLNSFDTAKLKYKVKAYHETVTRTEEFSLSDIDSDMFDDLPFSVILKYFNIVVIIAASAFILRCLYMTYRNEIDRALFALRISASIMSWGYLLVFFNGYYIKSKYKDEISSSVKVSGGPTVTVYILLLLMSGIAYGCYYIQHKVPKSGRSVK
ncbi:MAG: zinc ribbon domain-containing protein [Ruminococcus sp.]|nr:zinc ribbon domain-containing protein [Ruminococcus sp.]